LNPLARAPKARRPPLPYIPLFSCQSERPDSLAAIPGPPSEAEWPLSYVVIASSWAYANEKGPASRDTGPLMSLALPNGRASQAQRMRGEQVRRLTGKRARPFAFVGDAWPFGHHWNLAGPLGAVVRSGTGRPHDRLRPLGYTLIDAEGFNWFTRIVSCVDRRRGIVCRLLVTSGHLGTPVRRSVRWIVHETTTGHRLVAASCSAPCYGRSMRQRDGRSCDTNPGAPGGPPSWADHFSMAEHGPFVPASSRRYLRGWNPKRYHRHKDASSSLYKALEVGATGFEPATSTSRT
jgi:hypothetical protein